MHSGSRGQVSSTEIPTERRSASILWKIRKRVPRLLHSCSNPSVDLSIIDGKAIQLAFLLDHFQEQPQLLDPFLAELVPAVQQTYLEQCVTLQSLAATPQRAELRSNTLARVLSRLLYTLCKVRGEKIISRFLDNDPKNIDIFLDRLQDATQTINSEVSWEEEFILMLWLSCLVLTPFDLATVSACTRPLKSTVQVEGTEILSPVAHGLLEIAFQNIFSASRKQKPAAALIVRLVSRPDSLASQTCGVVFDLALKIAGDKSRSVYELLGAMFIINGLLSNADETVMSLKIARAFSTAEEILTRFSLDSTLASSSSIAKNFAIKIQKNVILYLIKKDTTGSYRRANLAAQMVNEGDVLERAIDALLQSLSDHDTLVRMAASKALSTIASNLDPSMTHDIIDAVLSLLREGVRESDTGFDTRSVNPVQWHGLILTLSHLVFRRGASLDQLARILETLFLALDFDQRSPVGYSFGTNVRDAANFGLWSLARKYKSDELLQIDPSSLGVSAGTFKNVSVLQITALYLVTAACCDPEGNVRRGASAALQELIGRHPNQIKAGIALVQTVDYNGIGLRSRAMVDIAYHVAKLDAIYCNILILGLLGWRGCQALNIEARENASRSIADLTQLLEVKEQVKLLESCRLRLHKIADRDVESRHGLALVVSGIITTCEASLDRVSPSLQHPMAESDVFGAERNLYWHFFQPGSPFLPSADYMSLPSTKSRLVASSVFTLLGALSSANGRINGEEGHMTSTVDVATKTIRDSLTLCLKYGSAEACPDICTILELYEEDTANREIMSWIQILERTSKPSSMPALITALCTVWSSDKPVLREKTRTRILDTFVALASSNQDMETRVLAINALSSLPDHSMQSNESYDVLLSVLSEAIQDYTISEQGDIGSWARLAALSGLERIDIVTIQMVSCPQLSTCILATYRLALEKLDKVRLNATKLIRKWQDPASESEKVDVATISSYEHFYLGVTAMLAPTSKLQILSRTDSYERILVALVTGLATSVSGGSEFTVASARAAAVDALESSSKEILKAFGDSLLTMLNDNISNDRVLVPGLELIALLLENGTLDSIKRTNRLVSDQIDVTTGYASIEENALKMSSVFRWRRLLSLTQKSHFQTTSIPKIGAAVKVYGALLQVDEGSIQKEVTTRLLSMLNHKFPTVRILAAETLWSVCYDACATTRAGLDTGGENPTSGDDRANEAFLERLRNVNWTHGGQDAKQMAVLLRNRLLPG